MAQEHPLLELQRLDSAADDLRARRAALPERGALRERDAELAALAHDRDEALARRAGLSRDERRVEILVADLEAKAREVEKSLYAGRVSALRELEGLQSELGELRRRQLEREEEEFALMEQVEQIDAAIGAFDGRRERVEAQIAALRGALAAGEAQIDAELAAILAQREALLPRLPAAQLAAFEKLRSAPRLAGRVVALLERGNCSECRVALPITLATRIESDSSDATAQCPQCHRILVR